MLKSIFDLCGANSQVNSELYLFDKKTGKQIKRLMPDYVGSIGSISGRKEHERFFLSTCQSRPFSTPVACLRPRD